MHVEQVLGDVPPDQRCKCRESEEEGQPPPGFANLINRFLNGGKGR